MKFKVDKDKCIGCGACASLCSDIFEIEDDGFANAKDEEVNDALKEDAITAMESCPTEAIEEVKEKKEDN